jgi:hypothetical protein
MTTATAPHRQSISALLDAASADAATFRCKAVAPPWAAAEVTPTLVAEPRLLTIAQAAEIVPLSVKQLYRVSARSDGPFRKIEGRLMAYEDDLHRWVRSYPTGLESSESRWPSGDGLADRVRRRRKAASA